jgi:hypothetical protein
MIESALLDQRGPTELISHDMVTVVLVEGIVASAAIDGEPVIG